jgi:hypothetical protein
MELGWLTDNQALLLMLGVLAILVGRVLASSPKVVGGHRPHRKMRRHP